MLRVIQGTDSREWEDLLRSRSDRLTEAERTATPILEAVRDRGDEALLRYAQEFDGLKGSRVRLSKEDLDAAARRLPENICDAVDFAAERIRAYAERQLPTEWMASTGDGIELGQLVRPLESVGAYVPGGRYPLPSTVMMTVVPAQAAGVERIAIASPRPSPVTVGVAARLGVEEVYGMGGAQAIAAFAFGTESVPRVDRIVGPGNAYVAAAKKLLAGETGIDFVAGPTEIVLVFDEGDPRALAADMLAQAEHDVDAAAILITTSARLAAEVHGEVERQLVSLPTADVARESIRNNSVAIVAESMTHACACANRFAPEHLAVSESVPLSMIRHAGSVFVGSSSPEAAGDYAAGPNHVLPTGGAARLRGGLSVLDYVKIISVQRLSPEGLRRIAPAVTTLARAEGLEAHARSVEARTGQVTGVQRA